MSYSKLREYVNESYRRLREDDLRNKSRHRWFMSSADSLSEVIDSMSSDEENATLKGGYKTDVRIKRIRDHVRLDYVCALRKDIRRQFFADGDDLFTDVSNYRLATLNARNARMFDNVLDYVLKASESFEKKTSDTSKG